MKANARSAPVVGYGRRGLLETMREGVTAELFAQQTVDLLTDAIERALDRSWDAAQLRSNAERFAPEHFRAGLVRSIEMALGTQAQHEAVALA